MTDSLRGDQLVKLLLTTGGLGLGLGCSCDYTQVRPLSQASYEALLAAHGNEPDAGVCAALCEDPSAVFAPASTGSTADTGGTVGTYTTYDEEVTLGCRLVLEDWTTPAVQCEMTNPNCGIGRRPAGLAPLGPSAAHLGRHFARVAQLESASVEAFVRLAAELAHHEAPASLQARALEAADDEARHADRTAALARRYGVEPDAPRIAKAKDRSLLELAIENAMEGCVGEALGAVQAAHAATHAEDPDVARAMATIAEDEARHAALSFDVHDWVRSQLEPGAQRALDDALQQAVDAQRSATPSLLSASDQRRGGVASREQQHRWLLELASTLWEQEAA